MPQHVKWLLALYFCATVNSDKKEGRRLTPSPPPSSCVSFYFFTTLPLFTTFYHWSQRRVTWVMWFYSLCEIQQSLLLPPASEQFTLTFTERIEERQGKLSVSFTLIHRVSSLSRAPTCSESGRAMSSSREAIWQWGRVGHLKVGLRNRQTYIGTFREPSLH